MLYIFAGLPGVGKSTLAKLLASELEAVYLRIDTIEQALVRDGLSCNEIQGKGYSVAYEIAFDNLRLGRVVVADSVNPIQITRNAWRFVAKRAGVKLIEIEVICSDLAQHKSQVETRNSEFTGHILPTWQEVLDREYDPWDIEPLRIDTAKFAPEDAVRQILER